MTELFQWRRFRQQMTDVEKSYKGAHLVVAAPNEAGVHDDYVDSLSCATIMSQVMMVPQVEIQATPWASGARRARSARPRQRRQPA